jgi:8-oxo-dGTP pyrophosphatase MutT (NUDIX family)
MDPKNPWKTLQQTQIYANRWLKVREDRVIRPDGQPGVYGVVEIPPSVGVVAINAQDEVALVGQWRYVNHCYSWEVPRGGAHDGETGMLAVAQRELREEAGIEAAHWRFLTAVQVCNGVTTDIQHLYLATELTRVKDAQDPEERITCRFVPFEEAIRRVMAGEITEVCSVAALLMVDRLRRG